jgi:hypothetical protein
MINKLAEQGFMKSGKVPPPIVATYFADALPALIGEQQKHQQDSVVTIKRRKHMKSTTKKADYKRATTTQEIRAKTLNAIISSNPNNYYNLILV